MIFRPFMKAFWVKNSEEIFSAWKIATISSAIDLAYMGYSNGRIYRDLIVASAIQELIPNDLINTEILSKAKQLFEEALKLIEEK